MSLFFCFILNLKKEELYANWCYYQFFCHYFRRNPRRHFGHILSEDFKNQLNLIFGVCSMGMGISSIGLMKYMPAVIFAIVVGTAIGLAINLGEWINKGAF